MNTAIDSKRIAKNTLLLYGRMFLVLLITLYTSRVILRTLGEVDYGIYNVVGGMAVMFGFLQSSMSAASQRYLSFELGKGNQKDVNAIFGNALLIHLIVGGIAVLLSEIVGLWLLSSEMTIPSERMTAAHVVLQCCIASFFISIVTVPYNADIISHERMNIFAAVGIVEVILKLAVALLLVFGKRDRLILYALLLLFVHIIIFFFYQIYSRVKFEEARNRISYDKAVFKDMFSFASWNVIGNLAYTFRMQGSNILLNIFFGPAVNAARGLANQVDGAIEQFVTNLQTAANPQIIKSYAIQDYKGSVSLTQQISRYSFYLVLCLGLPIMLNIDKILALWLEKVPEYTSVFAILIIVNGLIDSISKPLKTLIKATGRIKWYMIIQGGWYLLALPIIWLFLKLGYGPVSSLVVLVSFTFIGTFIRLMLIKNVTEGFSIRYFCIDVILPVLLVSLIAVALSVFCVSFFDKETLSGCFIRMAIALLLTLLSVVTIGIRREEKRQIISFVKVFYEKRKRK